MVFNVSLFLPTLSDSRVGRNSDTLIQVGCINPVLGNHGYLIAVECENTTRSFPSFSELDGFDIWMTVTMIVQMNYFLRISAIASASKLIFQSIELVKICLAMVFNLG
jgi:hypothetical protein